VASKTTSARGPGRLARRASYADRRPIVRELFPPEPIGLEWRAKRFHVDSSSRLFKQSGEQGWDPGDRPPAEQVATRTRQDVMCLEPR